MEGKFQKIDKFYLTLTVILVAMSVLLIVSFRSVFSMFLTASEVDPNLAKVANSLDTKSLNEAHGFTFERQATKLNEIPEIRIVTPTGRP
jgi:hypothetical protein